MSLRQCPHCRTSQSLYYTNVPQSPGGPIRDRVAHSPLERPSEKHWSETAHVSWGQFWNNMKKEGIRSAGKVIDERITVPTLQMGKTEAWRGKDACQVGRQIQ